MTEGCLRRVFVVFCSVLHDVFVCLGYVFSRARLRRARVVFFICCFYVFYVFLFFVVVVGGGKGGLIKAPQWESSRGDTPLDCVYFRDPLGSLSILPLPFGRG